jgi:hypothetical protein
LRELDRLFKDGLISQPEYETSKKELLKALHDLAEAVVHCDAHTA